MIRLRQLSLLLIVFSFSISASCQYLTAEEEELVDSLNILIDDPASHDTAVAQAYLQLSEVLYLINPDTLLHLCTESKKICERRLKNESDEKVRDALIDCLGGAINNLGYVYDMHGDIIKALEYYHTGLELKRKVGDDKGIATGLNNIAFTYDKLGQYETALKYYFESLSIRQKIGDKYDIANSYNNIGYVYDMTGENEKGLEYYQKSLNLQIEINDVEGAALSLNNIGSIYRDAGNNMDALACYHKSIVMFEETGDVQGVIYCCLNMAELYMALDDEENSLFYAERALESSQKLGYPDHIQDAARILSDVYEKKQEGMKALAMFKIFKSMADSINNDEIKQAVIEKDAEYEYQQQKSLDDAENEKRILLEREQTEKQRILTIASVTGLVLVGLFLVFVFSRLRITRQQKMLIEETHHELEIKNSEILDSIKYAKRIQKAILPSKKAVSTYLKNAFILYKPKDIISGDFYWLENKGDKILFAVADCTGHGVPGAMVSVVCNNALNRAVREHGIVDPGKLLYKARDLVIEEFAKSNEMVRDGMDIAICSLDLKSNTLEFAGAMNPLWLARQKEIRIIGGSRQAICRTDKKEEFATHTIELQENDVIYIFSDGYADQFGGEKGKKFKAKAFKALLEQVSDKNLDEQKEIIDRRFEEWRGSIEQVDDVCVLGLRV